MAISKNLKLTGPTPMSGPKPPICWKCRNEAVPRDAGVGSRSIPFWYCVKCKEEVGGKADSIDYSPSYYPRGGSGNFVLTNAINAFIDPETGKIYYLDKDGGMSEAVMPDVGF